MKRTACNFALFLLVLFACAATPVVSHAQAGPDRATSSAKWVGVWQGQLESVPGVVLTLGDDPGEVNGTIVFTVLRNGSVVGHEARVILHPRASGNTLSFQVKRPGDSSEMLDMSLTLADDGNGKLRCWKCGATSTAMQKMP
jgi:hypothetical protein